MNRIFLVIGTWIISMNGFGQRISADDSAMKITRIAAPRVNDLINTRLEVRFDYDKSWMYGKAWLTLRPHADPVDSLTLDAKGMDIRKLSLVLGPQMAPLPFTNDGQQLHIKLGRTVRPGQKYVIYLDYISKPDDLTHVEGSAAISGAKGLYFINPKGAEPDKPTQIWTQGETESNSTWMPTIDKPNQKSTESIAMTVPAKYVTLSNGKLVSQKKNPDGTRTDSWVMDLPHSPYLFFMGVGDFAVIHDRYKNLPVDYYVEKEYAAVARRIFGLTPEMIGFYEKILGIPFPWVKYAQMTGRDYVSGAMENTTCTLHTDAVQQDARQLTDGNQYENYVCHELFHQWFGDLVTAESWSNLTVNESFANFSETIWSEFKHGKDAGDAVNYEDMQKYLGDSTNFSKDLVRYHYTDRESVFDAISYMKGGRILNMLRKYLGDSVFYKSLHHYLETNKFKNAEAATLRMAFEDVSGQDLHWYWDQWYYGNGHPKLKIDYAWDPAGKKQMVYVSQEQTGGKIFRVPLMIDVYEGKTKTRFPVWLGHAKDSFAFLANARPVLVNVDAEKTLLCEKTDNKTLAEFITQYSLAGNYMDRREAIEYCATHVGSDTAVNFLKTALKDPFDGLRMLVMEAMDMENQKLKDALEPLVAELAKKDPSRKVQAKAIETLDAYHRSGYLTFFESKISDSSYSVSGNALAAVATLDSARAVPLASGVMDKQPRGNLLMSATDILLKARDARFTEQIIRGFELMPMGQRKVDDLPLFALMMLQEEHFADVKKSVDVIDAVKKRFSPDQREEFTRIIDDQLLTPIAVRKQAAGLTEQADYIRSKIAK